MISPWQHSTRLSHIFLILCSPAFHNHICLVKSQFKLQEFLPSFYSSTGFFFVTAARSSQFGATNRLCQGSINMKRDLWANTRPFPVQFPAAHWICRQICDSDIWPGEGDREPDSDSTETSVLERLLVCPCQIKPDVCKHREWGF